MVPKNRVIDKEEVKILAASMKEKGQKEPILVEFTGRKFKIIDGVHRYEAAKLLGWATINCFVNLEI